MAITVDPNEPFHVLLGGQVTPVSLEVLDTLYQDDTIQESTLIWQQGLGAWLRLDAVLAELEKQDPPAPQQREVEPDSYYVSFGENDVRLLSLDQLDKFYDLEVIDDATLVWQPGFAEWVPLAVLIGEADAPPVSIHPSLGPRQTAAHAPSGAPRAPSAPAPASAPPMRAPTQPMFSAPAPLGYSAPAAQGFGASAPGSAPGSMRPAPPSARPPASVLPAPTPLPAPSSRPAPLSSPSSRPAPLSSAPLSSQPYSLGPSSFQAAAALTLSAPPPPAKASPWFGRGLLAACFLVGLFVVQRNGVMMQIAEGAGQSQSWHKVEASMGGTGLDTPQGLSAWLSDLSTRHGLASLTPTEPIAPPTSAAAPLATSKLPSASAADPSRAATSPAKAGPADAKSTDIAEKMRAKLAGEPDPPAAPARNVSRPSGPSAKKRKNTGADAYDPMNGTL